MTVARRKGDAGKADMLFSRLIRSRGKCERCGDESGPFHTAHIIRRRYSATRCVEDNAWCLCPSCHLLVDNWAHEHAALVASTIGVTRLTELIALARAGTLMSSRLFWRGEVERVTARCKDLGVDTRWRAA